MQVACQPVHRLRDPASRQVPSASGSAGTTGAGTVETPCERAASSSARSALAKRKKLSAVLTLSGAAPVTVQLKR